MVCSWVFSLILKVPNRLQQILLAGTGASDAASALFTAIKMSAVSFDREPLVSKTWIALRRLDKHGSYLFCFSALRVSDSLFFSHESSLGLCISNHGNGPLSPIDDKNRLCAHL